MCNYDRCICDPPRVPEEMAQAIAAEAAQAPEEIATDIYVNVETGRRLRVVGEPREFVHYETTLLPYPWAKTFKEKVYPVVHESRTYYFTDASAPVEIITGTELAAKYERLSWPRHG